MFMLCFFRNKKKEKPKLALLHVPNDFFVDNSYQNYACIKVVCWRHFEPHNHSSSLPPPSTTPLRTQTQTPSPVPKGGYLYIYIYMPCSRQPVTQPQQHLFRFYLVLRQQGHNHHQRSPNQPCLTSSETSFFVCTHAQTSDTHLRCTATPIRATNDERTKKTYLHPHTERHRPWKAHQTRERK